MTLELLHYKQKRASAALGFYRNFTAFHCDRRTVIHQNLFCGILIPFTLVISLFGPIRKIKHQKVQALK